MSYFSDLIVVIIVALSESLHCPLEYFHSSQQLDAQESLCKCPHCMPYLVGESARHKGRQLCARLQTSPRGKAGSACGRKDGGESEDRLLVSRSEDRQANSLTPVLSESCQLVVSCSPLHAHISLILLGYFLQDHDISRCVIYSYLYTARNPRKAVEYNAKI